MGIVSITQEQAEAVPKFWALFDKAFQAVKGIVADDAEPVAEALADYMSEGIWNIVFDPTTFPDHQLINILPFALLKHERCRTDHAAFILMVLNAQKDLGGAVSVKQLNPYYKAHIQQYRPISREAGRQLIHNFRQLAYADRFVAVCHFSDQNVAIFLTAFIALLQKQGETFFSWSDRSIYEEFHCFLETYCNRYGFEDTSLNEAVTLSNEVLHDLSVQSALPEIVKSLDALHALLLRHCQTRYFPEDTNAMAQETIRYSSMRHLAFLFRTREPGVKPCFSPDYDKDVFTSPILSLEIPTPAARHAIHSALYEEPVALEYRVGACSVPQIELYFPGVPTTTTVQGYTAGRSGASLQALLTVSYINHTPVSVRRWAAHLSRPLAQPIASLLHRQRQNLCARSARRFMMNDALQDLFGESLLSCEPFVWSPQQIALLIDACRYPVLWCNALHVKDEQAIFPTLEPEILAALKKVIARNTGKAAKWVILQIYCAMFADSLGCSVEHSVALADRVERQLLSQEPLVSLSWEAGRLRFGDIKITSRNEFAEMAAMLLKMEQPQHVSLASDEPLRFLVLRAYCMERVCIDTTSHRSTSQAHADQFFRYAVNRAASIAELSAAIVQAARLLPRSHGRGFCGVALFARLNPCRYFLRLANCLQQVSGEDLAAVLAASPEAPKPLVPLSLPSSMGAML